MLKTKFEVFTTEDGEEMVRFPEYCYDNGKPVKYPVKKDTDGYKFVQAPNPYIVGKLSEKFSLPYPIANTGNLNGSSNICPN